MQNKVGTQVPSAAVIETAVRSVESARESVARQTISLTPDQRKSALKIRPGGERMVALLADLARKSGVDLPDMPIDAMERDLELAQALQPLSTAASTLQQRVDDTILEAQAECWHAATAYYTILQRMSSANPALADQLKPVRDFFATGRRRTAPVDPGNT